MTTRNFFFLLITIFAVLMTGCGSNPADSGAAGNSGIAAPTASLRVVLTPETISSLRAATTIYTVKVIVLVANPGNATTPYFKLTKEVDISGGSAETTFNGIEARPVVVQVLLNNASISGSRAFHGATDLQTGTTVTVTPDRVGAGSKTDLIARVALEFFNNPTMMAALKSDERTGNDLIEVLETITSGMTEFDGMLNTAVQAYNFTGMTAFQKDLTPSNLVVGGVTRTAAQIWSGGELWTQYPEYMRVKNIIRQGFDGYGLVHWYYLGASDNAIARISTDGNKVAYCRNYGAMNHFILLKDGSLLVAGFNDLKNAPVLFRWGTTGNASTYSTTGLTETGLSWSNYFTGLATDLSGYSIESISTDYESLIYVILKDGSGNRHEYRINLSTGAQVYVPGTPEDGKDKIIAYHAELQAILENNSLSDASRVSKFMTYIADDFKDIDGTPNTKSTLESTTLSRLERYIINSYTFSPGEVTIVDSSTIKVKTTMTISVTRKPGASGAVESAYINVIPAPELTWKRYGTEWKIYQGLPYKSSEISI
jgi:hypothetical protein